MPGPEFFRTPMGRTFYEGTMPRLVRELEALNGNLAKVAHPLLKLEPAASEELAIAKQMIAEDRVRITRFEADRSALLACLKELHAILLDGMQGDYDEMTAALKRARLTIEKTDQP